MNRHDFIQEGLTQLNNQYYYSPLEEDPQGTLILKFSIIKQGTNHNIINDNLKETLHNKFHTIPSFHMFPKYIRLITQEEP